MVDLYKVPLSVIQFYSQDFCIVSEKDGGHLSVTETYKYSLAIFISGL